MAPSQAKLDALPKELMVLIAEKTNLLSILNLAATNKSIRTTILTSLVFKAILTASQKDSWKSASLDLETLSHCASKDPSTWRRFAVADHLAWSHHTGGRISSHNDCTAWLPELQLVHHPSVALHLHRTLLPSSPLTPTTSASELFCRIHSALTTQFPFPARTARNINLEPPNEPISPLTPTLRALDDLIRSVRAFLYSRSRIWPYNDDAQVPYIPLPENTQIPFRPLDDAYNLPLPFARPRSSESHLIERSDWEEWFHVHSLALFSSEDFLTKGKWRGYYRHFHTTPSGEEDPMASYIPPPMYNIGFRLAGQSVADNGKEGGDRRVAVEVRAEGAYDGNGRFTLSGTIALVDRAVQFRGVKRGLGETCYWDCRLTPFGIVGFWGREDDGTPRGSVWLWKEEWTHDKEGSQAVEGGG